MDDSASEGLTPCVSVMAVSSALVIAVRNLKTVSGKFYRFIEILIVVFIKDYPAEVETLGC